LSRSAHSEMAQVAPPEWLGPWPLPTDANPYADFTSAGSLKMRYLNGLAIDELLARTDSSGNTDWYLKDQLGTVDNFVTTATSLDQVVYDPYGNIVTQTNATNADRFLFAGMEYDTVTGLYYDHARYYDAVIGRFVSQDPKGFAAGDTDLYRYTGNDPINNTDKTGLDDRWDYWWPANLTILPGYPGGDPPWIVQPGVSTDPLSPVNGPGTWKRVDGLWTLGGYLKIPNGAQGHHHSINHRIYNRF